MAEAPNQQNNDAPQFKPEEAVTFLANFGHDPEALKTKPPEDLEKLYTTANGYVTQTVDAKLKDAPAFKENWRQALAADDPDALKTLERFTDPQQLWKRTQELTKKLSSGELKVNAPFPKDGKPEEQAAWRKENGLPEKPEDYNQHIKLAEGLVIGDNDKPFVEDFLKTAHSLNTPPEAVNAQLNWYFGTHLPNLQKAQGEMDAEHRSEMHMQLHKVWGEDFKGNMNAVGALVQTMPEGIRDAFYSARMPDGTAFGNNAEILQWLAGMARELNPASAITGGGADAMKGVEDKIKEYEGMMRTNRQAWNKDTAAQAEYQKLLDLREKAKK